MEKYAKLMKGLEMCAGPECCKDGCPYYNTTTGGMTCRARLLLDANIAITNEQARAAEAEAERDALHADVDDLEAAANTLRAERDGMRIELERLTGENKRFRMLCQGKTDQPSASDDALKSEYKRGYLDAMEYCFRELCARVGGGGRHE